LQLLAPAAAACAQTTAAPPPRYAGEPLVVDRSDWVYSSNADGTGYREHTVAVTVQSEASLRTFGVVAIGFASASEHVELKYARVRHKDGSVTETPVSGALEQPEQVTREAPFYSDLKQEQLPIKNLQVGDTLEWQARIVRTRAEAPGQFWGADSFLDESAVFLEESIELRVPAASAVIVWTNPSLGVKAVETTEGGTKIYRWQTSQPKPTVGPDAEAEKKAKKTDVLTAEEELDADEGKLPSVAWTSFKDWAAVGDWYRGLEASRAVPDDEIKAKAAELTAGKKTTEEKVRALYAYVSGQIRYVGVAFGVGRYQPHEASDVLHNQYGDCKDKTTLLAALLAASGIPSDAALIGAQIRFNPAVPSPAAFNHLITHLKVDGREVWLDSTEEIAPYGMMLSVLRGHQALVVPPQGVATIETTPEMPPFAGEDVWISKGKLDKDGISESHIVLRTRGDTELVLRSVLRQLGPAQYDEFAQRFANTLRYSGTTSRASFSRTEDTDEPFTMEFDYHREKAGDWDNLRTIPQVQPLTIPYVSDTEPPTRSIDLGTPRTETSHAEMTLPAGWTVELPEAVHRKAAFATYDETYRFEKGTIITDVKLVILARKVPAADWKAYKKFLDAAGEEQYLQLVRASGEKADKKDAPADDTDDADASATALLAKAGSAMQQNHYDAAEEYLKKAEAKDPKAPKLWSAYAAVALMRRETNLAIEDCRKELALHPQEVSAYPILVSAQELQRNTDAAADTLRAWAMADPENPTPERDLAQVMQQLKRYPAAAEAANKAIELMGPEAAAKDEPLQLTLGTAQLKAGLTKRGEQTLLKLLDTTDDNSTMNGAAYELADANLDLARDEEKARVALDRMTAETQDWTVE
jgi:tetratricopeptide (TPR) repeat protein